MKTISLLNCLDNIIDYRGKTPKKLGFEWSKNNSGFRAISANNVKFDGLVKLDKINYGTEELYLKWMKEDVKKNDLLLTSEAPAGQVMLWDSDEKIILSQRLFALRTNNKFDSKYLKYYLQSKTGQNEINKNTSGSTVFGISAKMFSRIQVIYKDKVSQKMIGSVLYNLDKKIELNNQINQKLEAMAKTLYDYWFVQFDFPDANGKPYKSSGGKMVYSEALKREIPEGWEVFPLSLILKSNYVSIGKNNIFEEIEYLDTSNLTKNKIDSIECLKLGINKIPSRAKRVVNTNDILYSTVRPNLCHYGIIKHPLKNMIASTGFVQLSSKVHGISNDLIYTFLTSSWITNRLQQIASLSVSSYPSISPNDILELDIALPKEKNKLELINIKLDNIYSNISSNQKQTQKLIQLRDWLLPMLMNGQVTVADAKEQIDELMVPEPSVGYGQVNSMDKL